MQVVTPQTLPHNCAELCAVSQTAFVRYKLFIPAYKTQNLLFPDLKNQNKTFCYEKFLVNLLVLCVCKLYI